MKPSAFRYVVPADLQSAVHARAANYDSAVLSGGQSLIPTMNFRLSHPDVVIDLRLLDELDYVRTDPSYVRVGAMTRQRTLEFDDSAYRANPLIRQTLQNVAHPVIRNRGTVGGSLAHADPAAELPCLITTLRGELVAHGLDGPRKIPAADFFQFIFTTALEPDELLVEAAFPVLDPGEGWAFCEFARRHGDFAIVSVAAVARADAVEVTVGGVDDMPVGRAWPRLAGADLEDALNTLAWELNARDDIHADARLRRDLVRSMGRRTIEEAVSCIA